jgi:hypothetical protein
MATKATGKAENAHSAPCLSCDLCHLEEDQDTEACLVAPSVRSAARSQAVAVDATEPAETLLSVFGGELSVY